MIGEDLQQENQALVQEEPLAQQEQQEDQEFQFETADLDDAYFQIRRLFNGEDDQQPQPPNMATEIVLEDPYEGDINQKTTNGSKLFKDATKVLDKADRISIKPENKVDALAELEGYSRNFAWHKILTIQTSDGTKNLLTQSDKITLEDMQKHARKYFSNGTPAWADALPAPLTKTAITPST